MAKKNSVVERVASRLGFVPVTKLEVVATEAATKAAEKARSVMLLEIPELEKKAAATAVRRYAAAQQSRLTGNFLSNSNSADTEIRQDLRIIRERARALERDNDHVRKWLQLLETNVLGSTGIGLQMKVAELKKKPEGGTYMGYDKEANDIIEAGWREFQKQKNFTMSRKLTGAAAGRLILRSVARDGDLAIQLVRGSRAGNKFGFAIHLIESDQIDLDYNLPLKNGVKVVMGVETSDVGEPLAYWIRETHPGDNIGGQTTVRRRIPADEILNPFVFERIGQTRGVPWLVSAMLRLKQLGDYEHAELIAATISANKMGFFEHSTPEGWDGPKDDEGNSSMQCEAGSFEDLPMGTTFKPFDPQHPTTAFDAFEKACLRGIAAGIGVSYVSLSGDLEGVNFSSIRAGLLDEREVYKLIQQWFIDAVMTPIFDAWLEAALLSSALQFPGGSALPVLKIDKFNQPDWKPRRWQWVDPKSDVEATLTAINGGLTSRRRAISENSDADIEDIYFEQEADNELAEERGITFQTPSGQVIDSSGKDVNKDAPKNGLGLPVNGDGVPESKILVEKIGVGGVQGLIQVIQQVALGVIGKEQGIAILFNVFGIPSEQAAAMLPEKATAEVSTESASVAKVA